MKNEWGYKWKVGLFVLAGFALFAVAVFMIGKQQNLFDTTLRLKSVFASVSGLKVGNSVQFSGIQVGTVDDIRILSDTTVLVEMIIEKDVQRFVRQDAVVSIGSDGLMGDRMVIINPGSRGAKPVQEDATLKSRPSVEMDAIMASLQVTVENAAIITSELAEIMFKVNNGNGTLSRLISDESIGTNLSGTLRNLNNSTQKLDQNMEAAKHNILLRGFYKDQQKAAEQKEEALQRQAKDEADQKEKEARQQKRVERRKK